MGRRWYACDAISDSSRVCGPGLVPEVAEHARDDEGHAGGLRRRRDLPKHKHPRELAEDEREVLHAHHRRRLGLGEALGSAQLVAVAEDPEADEQRDVLCAARRDEVLPGEHAADAGIDDSAHDEVEDDDLRRLGLAQLPNHHLHAG